jgi:hypothetical protein
VASNPDDDVEVTTCLQVRGGFLKKAELLPVEDLGTGEYVKLNGKQPWLTALVSGSKCSRTAGEVVATLSQELRSAKSSGATSTAEPVPITGSGFASRRASMGFTDDEDDDDLLGVVDSPRAAKTRKIASPKGSPPASVVIRGIPITLTCRRRALYVKADQVNIAALVAILRDLRPADVVKRLKDTQDKRSQVTSPSSRKKGLGERWLFCRHTYIVSDLL